ncbi:reduced folate transporter-like [Haliotis rufescens]|uniref:reduced folate transporter-like n=1 Tax=Haliotis rufescens TaxID=6454 RepID=UPI00201F357C|nr:reduced folate transporter-like [Haliotis rufescens]XP_046348239.2 reduced folate transporter-like [Haliotis rufescens]
MVTWKVAVVSLCGVGFLKELHFLGMFRDSYLTSATFNLTQDQLEFEAYPVYAYSFPCVLVLVLLITDLVFYKPTISLGILALIAYTALLTWGRSLLVIQLSIFTAAFSSTTDIAYFGYAFAVAEPEKFHKVAGFSRIALLLGRLLAYAIGQVLVQVFYTDYFVLNCLTLGFMCSAFVFSVFLPSASLSTFQQVIERELQSPSHGMYQTQNLAPGGSHGNCSIQNGHLQGETTHAKRAGNSAPKTYDLPGSSLDSSALPCTAGPTFYDIDTSSLGFSYSDMMSECSDMSSLDRTRIEESQQLEEKENLKEKFMLSVNSFRETYTDVSVILWSVFWILATIVDFHVGASVHLLAEEHQVRNSTDATVESVYLLIAILCVLMTSFLTVNWSNFETFFLGGTSLVQSLLVALMAVLDNIWMRHSLYIAFRVLYQMTITIAMYRVASFVTGKRFAFVFGINMMVSGVIILIFTCAAAINRDTTFTALSQFAIYSGVIGFFGLGMICRSIYGVILHRRCGSSNQTRDDLDTLVTD